MKKMNKILTTVLVIALAALTLVGCAKKDTSPGHDRRLDLDGKGHRHARRSI